MTGKRHAVETKDDNHNTEKTSGIAILLARRNHFKEWQQDMPRDQLSPSKQILKADTMTHFHESIEHLCCVLIKLES